MDGNSTTLSTNANANAAADPRAARTNPQESAADDATPSLRQVRMTCLANIRYHAAREASLETAHRWLMFAVIALGAAAVVDAAPSTKAGAGAVAALLAALDLAFDLSNRARTHALIRRCYAEVLAEAERAPEALAAIPARLSAIYGDQPPVYQALHAACCNATELAVYGDTMQQVHIPVWHQYLKNVWRFDGVTYAPPDRRSPST